MTDLFLNRDNQQQHTLSLFRVYQVPLSLRPTRQTLPQWWYVTLPSYRHLHVLKHRDKQLIADSCAQTGPSGLTNQKIFKWFPHEISCRYVTQPSYSHQGTLASQGTSLRWFSDDHLAIFFIIFSMTQPLTSSLDHNNNNKTWIQVSSWWMIHPHH